MVVVQEFQVLKHIDEADVLRGFQDAIELRENCVSLIFDARSL
jgi:hypothetical protein